MLIVRKAAAGGYVELSPGQLLLERVPTTADVRSLDIVDGDVVVSTFQVDTMTVLHLGWDWARTADPEHLRRLGYWRLQHADAPAGKRQTSYTIEDRDGAPVLVPEYEDIPAPPAPQPAPPPPRVPSISFRQFLLEALAEGRVKDTEALGAATTREIPKALRVVFDKLPDEAQVPALITWATMAGLDRDDTMTGLFAAAYQMDDDATDTFFRAASAL